MMMPGVNGMGVLRGTIEALPEQRVLILSALSDVDSVVTTGGADPKTLDLCRNAGGQVIIA